MDKGCTRVYLLRHGETVNHKGLFKYNGQNDVDVTPQGEAQLAAQAERLKGLPLAAVYSSDLTRAKKGARAIAGRHSLEAGTDPRLREISAGRWEGLSYDEVAAKFPEEAEERFRDIVHYRIKEGGENLLDVRGRSMAAISEIVERHRGEEVAVVAHGGVNRIILCEAMGLALENLLRMEQDFGCLNMIDYYDGTAVVRLLNLKPDGVAGKTIIERG